MSVIILNKNTKRKAWKRENTVGRPTLRCCFDVAQSRDY